MEKARMKKTIERKRIKEAETTYVLNGEMEKGRKRELKRIKIYFRNVSVSQQSQTVHL